MQIVVSLNMKGKTAAKRSLLVHKIKNPWRKRRGVVVFDIETDLLEGRTEDDKRSARFRCGVAYVYDEDTYYEFLRPRKFVEFLKKAKTLVSYNGEGFDFLVLAKYGLKILRVDPPFFRTHPALRFYHISYEHGWSVRPEKHWQWLDSQSRWRPKNIVSYDLMHTIHENRTKWHKDKKYPSLKDMIRHQYGEQKTPHDHDDAEQLLRHCREDVEYTKRLYEEKTWSVPALERRGAPIGSEKNPLMVCPLCGGKLAFSDTDDWGIECRRCGLSVAIAPWPYTRDGTPQEGGWNRTCENCRKDLVTIIRSHIGYGAKHGTIKRGRSLCPICREGCYEWRNDNAPGFREHWRGSCCSCGKNIDRWKQRRAKASKATLTSGKSPG